VSELGPNAYGELPDPGRVADCYLALPLPADDDAGPGQVLVVAPRALLHPAVAQPAGSLLYELVTGHPDRASRELVFPADHSRPALRTVAYGGRPRAGNDTTGHRGTGLTSPARAPAKSRYAPNARTCLSLESGSWPGPTRSRGAGPRPWGYRTNRDESRLCRGPGGPAVGRYLKAAIRPV